MIAAEQKVMQQHGTLRMVPRPLRMVPRPLRMIAA